MLTLISDFVTAANVGIMLFFSVAVAPTIFMVLPPEWSGAYVRKFFPKYFLFLGFTTAIAAALHGLLLAQISLALCALVFFFSCFWLTPRINEARDNKQEKVFNTLHYTSVGLNLAQLVVMIWLLVKSALAT
jgi:Domain of unknown function (DUF4149)